MPTYKKIKNSDRKKAALRILSKYYVTEKECYVSDDEYEILGMCAYKYSVKPDFKLVVHFAESILFGDE